MYLQNYFSEIFTTDLRTEGCTTLDLCVILPHGQQQKLRNDDFENKTKKNKQKELGVGYAIVKPTHSLHIVLENMLPKRFSLCLIVRSSKA